MVDNRRGAGGSGGSGGSGGGSAGILRVARGLLFAAVAAVLGTGFWAGGRALGRTQSLLQDQQQQYRHQQQQPDRQRQQQQQQRRRRSEEEASSSGDALAAAASSSSSAAATGGVRPTVRNSGYECTDGSPLSFSSHHYGKPVQNRSCLYTDLLFAKGSWHYVALGGDDGKVTLPDVTLASKPVPIGKKSLKYANPAAYKKMERAYGWRPAVVDTEAKLAALLGDAGGPPRRLPGLTALYAPEVAPWNYAHTLLNDLFPIYWGARVLLGRRGEEVPRNTRVVVYDALYGKQGWLKENNAFPSFTSEAPVYDGALAAECAGGGCTVERLLVGTGGKTWSFVTTDYASPGDGELWAAYRAHILAVLGVEDRDRMGGGGVQQQRPYKLLVCDKKGDSADKKRGIVNAREVAKWAEEGSGGRVKAEAVVLSSLPIREQTRLMVSADAYACNEGTMGTAFFLLPPGSVWLSVMNVFRRDEKFDLYRPHSTRHFFWNTGGNIDWFAPAIPWVKALYYDRYLAGDVIKDTTASNFRNYLPNWSVKLDKRRFDPLLAEAVSFLDKRRATSDGDNHSVMGRMCKEMMHKSPGLQTLFPSIKCRYGMSWLCEYLVNGHASFRNTHPKWRKGCGRQPTPRELNVTDPRDKWLAEEGIPERPREYHCETAPDGGKAYPCPEEEGGGTV